MKNYLSFFKISFVMFASLVLTGCVHDDKYNDPDLTNYGCVELVKTKTLQEVKALYTGTTYVFPENTTDVIEGYVSSSDETGNIYKTIYIQDARENPTQGFVISVDAVSTYARFPQGSKIFIKLNGLAIGTYGGLVQLGVKDPAAGAATNGVARIPEKMIPTNIFKSCEAAAPIVPKVMTLADMNASNDKYLGCLIQIPNAEFDVKALCSVFAPAGTSVDRQLNDPTTSATTRVVRNSGFASFANQMLPAGRGTFIGIFSKFNASYQMYINKLADLADMRNFPRKDGITSDPCVLNESALTVKTVAEVKQLYTGALGQINGDYLLKAKVTANDETGNLFKYIYVEDATGAIRININKNDLFQDERFKVGKELYIKLKGLYTGANAGEIQLGVPFNGNIGQVLEVDVYKHFFDSKKPATAVVPTERTITQLTTADVGRWVKIKNVQFADADLGKPYASGSPTNRNIEDCQGNKIILRTSHFATFAGAEIDGGKGDLYAIVSIFNGVYQLWIPFQYNADFDDPRCDGTVPATFTSIFTDGFDTLANWTAVNVAGTQVWATTTFGNPRPSAIMDGNRVVNEDWLVSKKITITGFTDAYVSFETDGRFTGNPLELYVTENYTGTVGTTSWTKLNAALDTDLNGFSGFVGSGRVSLKSYLNKEVVFAFKYTSVAGSSTTWEVDNFAVKGSK
ncbi:hypothetical protein FIC_02376 [Flavobacteriaceae bacterium 3519-10]|nr:hypothetical protein FIC_02376 [Flavobacteriaceae bacterium 3519-10]